MYSRDGKLIAQFGEQRRIPLAFEAIPQVVVDAVLAAEDDRFFQHPGVDWHRARARANCRRGEKRAGRRHDHDAARAHDVADPGEDLSTQAERDLLALRIERELSKQEILALYLNKMFLGQRAYGVGAAAEVYFGKTRRRADAAEVALLAGTFRLPSRDNPVANAEARAAASRTCCGACANGFITRRVRHRAREPVESRLQQAAVEVDAPYVGRDGARRAVEASAPRRYTAGYQVVTTVDSRLQRGRDARCARALLEYDQRHGYRGPAGASRCRRGARRRSQARSKNRGRGRRLVPARSSCLGRREGDGRCARAAARLGWDGCDQLGARRRRTGSSGRSCSRSDVLKRGDIVYVRRPRRRALAAAQVPEVQGALVALDPNDGAIRALTGGFDYFASSTAWCRRSASRARRSSRSCTPRRSSRASRRRA